MRSQPAHISLTDASTPADALSPPNKKGPHTRARLNLPLDKNPLHISSIVSRREVRRGTRSTRFATARQAGVLGLFRRSGGCRGRLGLCVVREVDQCFDELVRR